MDKGSKKGGLEVIKANRGPWYEAFLMSHSYPNAFTGVTNAHGPPHLQLHVMTLLQL